MMPLKINPNETKCNLGGDTCNIWVCSTEVESEPNLSDNDDTLCRCVFFCHIMWPDRRLNKNTFQ